MYFWSGVSVMCVVWWKVLAVDVGEPLILTTLIEKGGSSIAHAVKQSRVTPDIQGVTSHSGFLTVNSECGSHIFFWFFQAEVDWKNAPLLLWLNGSPGESSMSGVFEEVGPLHIVDGNIAKMKYPWTKNFNVLFLDQPAGTGFSISRNKCYPTSVKASSRQTYVALTQFFTMFPHLQENPFFITGNNFVSHTGPALAVVIKKENAREGTQLKINLKGVVVINPRASPECQDFSNIIYNLGIADQKEKNNFHRIHSEILQKVGEKRFSEAAALERKMLSILTEEAKLPSYHNFVTDQDPHNQFVTFITDPGMRQLLHVGDVEFDLVNEDVHTSLLSEYFASPREGIEKLLETAEVFVGFYNGQLEIANPYSATLCFLRTIRWPDKEIQKAERYSLKLGDQLVGWFKSSGNFFEILVRNIGQFTAMEQRAVGLKLLQVVFKSSPNPLLQNSSE